MITVTNLLTQITNFNLMAQTEDSNAEAWCKACIVGLDGSIWTTEKHPNALKINVFEASNIARCFRDKDFTPFETEGSVFVEGSRHIYVRELDGKFVWARGARCCIFLHASKTAIVITSWPKHSSANVFHIEKGVDIIVKHLESQNM